MNTKILIPAISMISVLVMFIWSYIEGSWAHCWLAPFAGGIAITIVSRLQKEKQKKQQDEEK
jgi:uncharacterized membrane protein YjjP (DUF1212 family)